MIEIKSRQLIGLYLFLNHREAELDEPLQQLYNELQRDLFSYLSIEEMESLEELYKNNIDVLKERGYI
ncbi:MAG: hypothetical protein R6V86_12795 [Spirochaetia bacterium]